MTAGSQYPSAGEVMGRTLQESRFANIEQGPQVSTSFLLTDSLQVTRPGHIDGIKV